MLWVDSLCDFLLIWKNRIGSLIFFIGELVVDIIGRIGKNGIVVVDKFVDGGKSVEEKCFRFGGKIFVGGKIGIVEFIFVIVGEGQFERLLIVIEVDSEIKSVGVQNGKRISISVYGIINGQIMIFGGGGDQSGEDYVGHDMSPLYIINIYIPKMKVNPPIELFYW